LTGIKLNWTIDHPVDSRVEYSQNQWMLDSTWVSSIVNYTETFEHVKGDINTTSQLYVRAPYYISTASVVSTNSSHSANYVLNTSGTGPATITFLSSDDIEYQNWTVTYIMNKTIVWNSASPSFELSGLDENTTYYYRVWAYSNLNSSSNNSFTLGTPPSTSIATIYNYTENRPDSQVTVCGELTDMNGEPALNCSIQYFNEDSVSFNETSKTEMSGTGIFCKTIDVDYGYQYGYRTKCGVDDYVIPGAEENLTTQLKVGNVLWWNTINLTGNIIDNIVIDKAGMNNGTLNNVECSVDYCELVDTSYIDMDVLINLSSQTILLIFDSTGSKVRSEKE
jgi:hypothetical protein